MKYRIVILVLLFLWSFRLNAQHLYVFNTAGKYGLCDSRKHSVVEPVYSDMEPFGSFYVGTKAEKVFDVFSAEGVLIGTCNSVNKVSDTTMLALWYSSMKRPEEYRSSRMEMTNKKDVEKPRGALFFSSGRRDTLPGVVAWYDASAVINRVMIDSAGWRGVLQLVPLKVVVPVRYREIMHKSYWGYLLGWNDSTDYALYDKQGRTYPVDHRISQAGDVFFNANWFTVDSTKPYRVVYNRYGQRVNVFDRALNPAELFDDGKKLLVYGKDSSLIIDSTGRTIDKVPSRQYAGYGTLYQTKQGLFNLKTRKYQLLTKDTSVRIANGLCPAVTYCAIVKGEAIIFDAFGEEIVRIPRTGLSPRENSPYFRSLKGVHFYRSTTKGPWVAYNGSLTRRFPNEFSDIHHVYVAKSGMFLAKTKQGWGLFRVAEVVSTGGRKVDSMMVVIPPVSDTIEECFGVFKAVKKQATGWYDADGKPIAADKSVDMLTDQVMGGLRLGYEVKIEKPDWYNTNIIYTKILLIDSMGKVQRSLNVQVNDANGYPGFMLVNGHKVTYFDNGIAIWNAKTGKVNRPQIAYQDDNIVRNDKGPLAVICTERGGDEAKEGVYSLIEEKMIIPFGRYDKVRGRQYSSTAVAFYINPFVDPRIMAIYDENGELY